jgi:hypothetical protein
MRNTNHTDQLHLALREARDAAFDVHGAFLKPPGENTNAISDAFPTRPRCSRW